MGGERAGALELAAIGEDAGEVGFGQRGGRVGPRAIDLRFELTCMLEQLEGALEVALCVVEICKQHDGGDNLGMEFALIGAGLDGACPLHVSSSAIEVALSRQGSR